MSSTSCSNCCTLKKDVQGKKIGVGVSCGQMLPQKKMKIRNSQDIYLTPLSQVDILKHSIQYIQKLRSLVETHHHQTSSSGESLRHLVETHHQNLVEQIPLGGVETSPSPHPFSQQEHHSPDGRYHPSDSQFSPSSSTNSSNYPHLHSGEGSQTNGHYPHHASPTSPPLMPSPDR